jgi:DNA-binding CsgD family transcriptional regulator
MSPTHLSPTHQDRLPETLQRWINYQIALFTQSDHFTAPTLPLQLESKGKRLTIRFLVDHIQGQYLLLLEEQPPQSFSIDLLESLGLTRREAEVLLEVSKDKNNKDIGTILGCSDKTVKKHLENIYSKLGVQSRSAAVLSALQRLGMLP